MNPVNWFEIPVHDIKESKAFYDFIFGFDLQIIEMGSDIMAWFPFDHEKPGCTGSLVQAESYIPSHKGTMVYFSVESIEDVLSRAEQKEGKILTKKMSIGEHGFIGHFEDNSGNRIGLHSTK